ncbi:DUF4282 domain-containing protein [Corynebacterium falsenii]|uniref:DUF4282 domain-containing protein n=1 Tax=Corynebacterium falsenii TaxID=108486 RepID=UPI001D8DBD85|nr:DUF4282 domain-containing protein [Corynebacterium falsenii]HJF11376.1 DUF4282 domain-containing protein [Corynebacterium falsenii]
MTSPNGSWPGSGPDNGSTHGQNPDQAPSPNPSAPPQFGPKTSSFLSSLGDMSFTKYITSGFLRTLYIVGIVFIVLNFIFNTVFAVQGTTMISNAFDSLNQANSSAYGGSDNLYNEFGPQPQVTVGPVGVLTTALVYAVIAFFQICALRITLEVANALVRTAEAWARIQKRVHTGTVTF